MILLVGLRFTRGDSPLHRLDPRVKFLLTIVIFSSSLIFFEIIPLTIIFILQIPLMIIGKIWREWLKTLKGGLFLAVIIFSTNIYPFISLEGSIYQWILLNFL